jgi:hypothetical protein
MEMGLQNTFGQYCSLCRSVNEFLGVTGIAPKDGRIGFTHHELEGSLASRRQTWKGGPWGNPP